MPNRIIHSSLIYCHIISEKYNFNNQLSVKFLTYIKQTECVKLQEKFRSCQQIFLNLYDKGGQREGRREGT